MASFLPSLWESVFVSGPTPTLLLATNATFFCLQLVLFLLLLATYSIHFAILSVLCGGLWWAINWFAAEVAAVRAEEEAREAKEKGKERDGSEVRAAAVGGGAGGDGESADDEGESTEVEDAVSASAGAEGLEASRGSLSLSGFEEGAVRSGREEEGGATRQRNVRARQAAGGDLSGEISTDSEWEKVEDGR